VIDKIKSRMASHEGFTLIELLVVIVILGILVAIAVPGYLSLVGKAAQSAAQSDVRSAVPAAESYYRSNTAHPLSYTGLTGALLRSEAPGIGPNVEAAADSTGNMYCIQDSEGGGTTVYSYLGGAQASTTAGAATIVPGACPSGYGVS
jgi:type IV pilus assembly protein PilA